MTKIDTAGSGNPSIYIYIIFLLFFLIFDRYTYLCLQTYQEMFYPIFPTYLERYADFPMMHCEKPGGNV